MRSLGLSRLGLGLLGAVSVLLAGCTPSESGDPVADSPNPDGGPSSSSVPSSPSVSSSVPSSSANRSTDMASLDLCSLLSEDEIAEFGDFEDPERKEYVDYPSCSWTPIQDSAQRLPTITFIAWDGVPVEYLVDEHGAELEESDSGRKLAQTKTARDCTTGLAVDEESRVDVAVTGVDGDEACALADEIADVVEPRIPES